MFTDLMPMSNLNVFRNFDRDFEELMKSTRADFKEAFPPINVSYSCVADDKACYIEMALAGYSKDEISVEVVENKITVSAKVAEPTEEETKEKKYLKQRIKKQNFSRTYIVPTDIYNLDASEVTYTDGLLTIIIPAKEQEEPKIKKINIK